MSGVTQQVAPNPGIAKDDAYRSSLYSLVSQLSTATGILLRRGDDVAAAVNRTPEKRTFLLLPGVYGKAGTVWVLTKPCRLIAMPGVTVYASIEVQGGDSEFQELSFEGGGQLKLNSNGNTARGIRFGQTCTVSPLIQDAGVYNRVSECTSRALTPGALGVDVQGSSAIVFANDFMAHATAVRYNLAGGHQLGLNLGVITGV